MKLQQFLAAAAAALMVTAAHAQAPAQPTARIVTGSTPGAGLDLIARVLAAPLSTSMKRNFIVDNKPGASYNLAADHVAKAAPDGNTILLTYMAHSLVGTLFPKLPFDPLADFKPVILVAATPLAAVAHPSVRGANLKEVLALAKAEGRTLTFATPGMGTPQHLMMERLRAQTGASINMIHYKSAVQGQTEVIGGHVDLTLSSPAMGEQMVRAKMLKPLAVTGTERLHDYADTPAASELGFDEMLVNSWYVMLLPAKTPPEIVKAYNDALNAALSSPAVIEKFRSMGLKPLGGSPDAADRHVRAQAALWGRVIKQANISLE